MKTLVLSLTLLFAGSSLAIADQNTDIATESCETCINNCDNVDDISSCIQSCVDEGPCRDHPKYGTKAEESK